MLTSDSSPGNYTVHRRQLDGGQLSVLYSEDKRWGGACFLRAIDAYAHSTAGCQWIDEGVNLMEHPQALQGIKREITSSIEWERVVHYVFLLLGQPAERELLTNFEKLPRSEKYDLMRNVAGQLQRTTAFKDLQSTISSTLVQSLVSLPPLVFLSTDSSQFAAGSFSDIECSPYDRMLPSSAARTCSDLLLEHSHLKHYLKKCFNHPLPAELRAAAWKVLLQHKPLRAGKEYLEKLSLASFEDKMREDMEVVSQCEVILGSSRFLSSVAKSSTIVDALKDIMVLWSHCKSARLSDTDFLLCLPFLYVWESRLVRVSEMESTDKVKDVLRPVAEIFIHFMDILPHTSSTDVSI